MGIPSDDIKILRLLPMAYYSVQTQPLTKTELKAFRSTIAKDIAKEKRSAQKREAHDSANMELINIVHEVMERFVFTSLTSASRKAADDYGFFQNDIVEILDAVVLEYTKSKYSQEFPISKVLSLTKFYEVLRSHRPDYYISCITVGPSSYGCSSCRDYRAIHLAIAFEHAVDLHPDKVFSHSSIVSDKQIALTAPESRSWQTKHLGTKWASLWDPESDIEAGVVLHI